MKKRILILVISYVAASCITHNNQLIASEPKKDLVAKGLTQLTEAFIVKNGYMQAEVKNKRLENAISMLKETVKKDEKKTTEQLISFFKEKEAMQLLIAYGFIDKLLQKIDIQPRDLDIAPFIIPANTVDATPESQSKIAKPFPYLFATDDDRKTNVLSCVVQGKTSIQTYRLSENYDNLTRVIKNKKTKQETVLNSKLDKAAFLSIIIGKTKVIFVRSQDKETYQFDVKSLALDKNIISFEKKYKDAKNIINLQLSPDERFLLIQANNNRNYNSVINDLRTGAKTWHLTSTKFKWEKEHTDKILTESRWGEEGNEIISSSYGWPLGKIISPTTQLKLALYYHWFKKITEEDLKAPDALALQTFRQLFLMPLPEDAPVKIKEEIAETHKKIITKHDLQKFLQ